MDYVRIGKLEESDFDTIVENAGGQRFMPDESRENRSNCDYVLGEAVLELKIIEEEGLEKKNRQRKLADIFRTNQPDRPVIILQPAMLDEAGQRGYFTAMAGPIKTQVKKAAKQLEESRSGLGTDPVRVLLLINNGYATLSHEEFKQIAFKCACHDTRKIDCLVVGGAYYYSDKFEHYALFPLEHLPVNAGRPFDSFDRLKAGWNAFNEIFMTKVVRGQDGRVEKKLPVVDLQYDLDGVTYIKPAPRIGKSSKFWVNGRPRANSTGIEACPPVARTFPKLDFNNWQRFRNELPSRSFFRESYSEWLGFQQDQDEEIGTSTEPFVPVEVTFEDYSSWCKKRKSPLDVATICEYANELFCRQVRQLIDRARDRSETAIVVPEYISVITEEIGQDKANDISTITLVCESLGGCRQRGIIKNTKLFFEHALALACACVRVL